MAKKFRGALILFVLMFAFKTNAVADSKILTNVKLSVDGESKNYSTNATSVGEFLASEGFLLSEKDRVNLPLDEKLNGTESVHIKLQRSYLINVVVDNGEAVLFEVGPIQKVGHIISELEAETGRGYSYEGFLNERIAPFATLHIATDHIKDFVITTMLPFERETRYTTELAPGEAKVIQEGKYGELTTVTKVVYSAGEEVGRTVESVSMTREAQNEILLVGNSSSNDANQSRNMKNGYEYEYELVMEATAYSAKQKGLSNYTKSGDLAVYGVVAVDPKVIPLGTWLYIEGYGKALASDTGGHIKGDRIDLCFNSVAECFQFGRRDIKVYVLK